MRTSVVIPTFRRPERLRQCLDGLRRQERLPDEVLIAVRDDDPETAQLLANAIGGTLRIQAVPVGVAGASEARNLCIARARGEILIMTDDDTVPYPDWVARIHAHFVDNARLGALGGPDWIGGRDQSRATRPHPVGAVQWWGRRVGNHHRGAPGVRSVEWLKGANMSIRRSAFEGMAFGEGLRGAGAQFAEDVDLSLRVKRRGWLVCYDPAVAVDHFPGALTAGGDHRSLVDSESLVDAAHNEAVALLRYLPPARRVAFMLWSILVGTRLLPGLMMVGYQLVMGRDMAALQRGPIVCRGRLQAWRTWAAEARNRPITNDAAGWVPSGPNAAGTV